MDKFQELVKELVDLVDGFDKKQKALDLIQAIHKHIYSETLKIIKEETHVNR